MFQLCELIIPYLFCAEEMGKFLITIFIDLALNFPEVKWVKLLKCTLHGKLFMAEIFYFDTVPLLCNAVLIFLIMSDFLLKRNFFLEQYNHCCILLHCCRKKLCT